MKIYEKIKNLRKAVGLTQDAFAEKIGISTNTIKSIEGKGGVPRADVIESIATAFPEYGFWLITGKTDGSSHISPTGTQVEDCRIIQSLSVTDCETDRLLIKSEYLHTLYFLQADDEIETVACIATVKNPNENHNLYQNLCLKIGEGELHFDSRGGKNKLERFRAWLENLGRHDLIITANLITTKTAIIENLFRTKKINIHDLMMRDVTDVPINSVFINWKNNNNLDDINDADNS